MFEKLSTIQKRDKLNEVYVDNTVGPGGGRHLYVVLRKDAPIDITEDGKLLGLSVGEINFQKGPRTEESSIHGILDADLLEIVRDRLKVFQDGPYKTRENACALTHIEEALMWMNKRVEDRAERGVLGTNIK